MRRPIARCPSFRLSIDADIGGAERSLFAVTGACSGAELRLTADSIPFGTVLLGSEVISPPALFFAVVFRPLGKPGLHYG